MGGVDEEVEGREGDEKMGERVGGGVGGGWSRGGGVKVKGKYWCGGEDEVRSAVRWNGSAVLRLSSCSRPDNERGSMRGDSLAGRGSSLSSTAKSVARRLTGLAVVVCDVEGRGGRSMRARAGGDCVMGEFSTASRTGSKGGIVKGVTL